MDLPEDNDLEEMRVRVVFTNEKAWRSLRRLLKTLVMLEDDLVSYRPEIRKAVKDGRYALNNIEVVEDYDGKVALVELE